MRSDFVTVQPFCAIPAFVGHNKQRLFPYTELNDCFYIRYECLLRGTDYFSEI